MISVLRQHQRCNMQRQGKTEIEETQSMQDMMPNLCKLKVREIVKKKSSTTLIFAYVYSWAK